MEIATPLDLTTVESFRVRAVHTEGGHPMISFEVDDMTCNHCAGTLAKALKSVDDAVKLRFDLAAHRVDIESAKAGAPEFSAAIRQAGYMPVRVGSPRGSDAPGTATKNKGCCCS